MRYRLVKGPPCARNTVQQQLEQMVIPAIDERDANRCSFECLGGSKASESAPDDDDVWCLHDWRRVAARTRYVQPQTRHYLDAAQGR